MSEGTHALGQAASGDATRPGALCGIFVSYARKDAHRLSTILTELEARGFRLLRDIHEILPAEEWKPRLRQLIEEADVVVFFLSPASVASEVCAWEVEISESLRKKIVPVVIEETKNKPPGHVADLNYIYFNMHEHLHNAVETVTAALTTDIAWVREHARLGVRAQRWDGRGRPSGELLRGKELGEARAWISKQIRDNKSIGVTPLHKAYISASEAEAEYEHDFTVRAHTRYKVVALIAAFSIIWLAIRFGGQFGLW